MQGVFLVPLIYKPTVPKPLMVSTRVCLYYVVKKGNLFWYQKCVDAPRNMLAVQFLAKLVDYALAAFCAKKIRSLLCHEDRSP